ncbi:MAG: NAD-dependent epimerase/dehydratase family protein [Candidatus Hydrogenedentota bacterium]|nr:MAG: NAD-dependent epimerase/dehydratase family protein [Candidatus Hydrogenedentota bacterium]
MAKATKKTTRKNTPGATSGGRRVLLTGTSGFLGSHLLNHLNSDDRYERLIAVDTQRPPFKLRKTKFYQVDLTHPRTDEMLVEILSDEKPDIVVHTGFYQRPIEDTTYAHEVNSIGTMHILSACAESPVRKIVVGSRTLVYGAQYDNPHYMSEDHPPRPRLDYEFQLDKVEVERQLLRFWKDNPSTIVTALRHCSIIGPTVENCWTHYLSMPVCPTVLGYNPLIQFISEEDVIGAFKLAVDEDFPGVFNIVGNRVIPLSMVLKLANKPRLPMPYPVAENLFRVLWITRLGPFPPEHLDFLRYHCLADGSRAREVMGFEAKKTAWQALEEFLEVRRLGRVGRPTEPGESAEEMMEELPAAHSVE